MILGILLLCLLNHSARSDNLWKEVKAEAEKEWKALKEQVNDGVEYVEEDLNGPWKEIKAEAQKGWKTLQGKFNDDVEYAEEDLKDEGWISDLWDELKETEKDSKSSEEMDDTLTRQGIPNSDRDDTSESKESKEDVKGEDADISRCSDLCLYSSAQAKISKDQDLASSLCSIGCRQQIKELKALQATFPQSLPEMLMGSAIDKCWDGCLTQQETSSRILCNSGCETMQNILKDKMRDSAEELEAKKEEVVNDIKMEKKDEEFNVNNNNKINELAAEAPSEEEEDGQSIVWTYVLWRPQTIGDELSSFNQEDASQSYSRLVNTVLRMIQGIDAGEETGQDLGWRDDRMQLRFPDTREPSPMTGSMDDSVYSRLTESLDSIKDRVQSTMAAPDFQQNMYYVLIGISALLLIAATFNTLVPKRNIRETLEDHYYLTEAAMGAKLPTYEDCVKADSDLMAGLVNQAETYTSKEKLPLPTFVVMEAVVSPAVTITEPAAKEDVPTDTNNVV